mmetsp:Transcript_21015/g.24341  ORF Transcript_21015/g.24341 Transcript_21015/m.24341 type:complete len:416 (-) Transcript_21015:304-1551(-)
MLGLSVSDIVGSTAIALTHLPIPAEGQNHTIDGYGFEGVRQGSTQTCTAQGFFAILGFTTTVLYNCMLCIYYYCAIGFNMSEEKIEQHVEPYLHLVAILIGFSFSLSAVFLDVINPSPYQPWCDVVSLPYECGTTTKDMICERGFETSQYSKYVIIVFYSIIYVIIISSLGIVVRKVWDTQRQIQQELTSNRRTLVRRGGGLSELGTRDRPPPLPSADRGDTHQSTVTIASLNESHIAIKVTLIQAISYVVALVLTSVFMIIDRVLESSTISDGIELRRLIYFPLQGFFNFSIFISAKVFNLCHSNQDMTVPKALYTIFCGNASDPIISRISIVSSNDESNENTIIRAQIGDELFVIVDEDEDAQSSTSAYHCSTSSSSRKNGSRSISSKLSIVIEEEQVSEEEFADDDCSGSVP